MCEIDGLFRFQNGLNKLSGIGTNRLKSEMVHKMILLATIDIFKICSHFSENVVFQKFIKPPDS